MVALQSSITVREVNNSKGTILLAVIIILMFLSVLGLNLMVYLLNRTTKTTLEVDRLKAYYLAEAGIAQSIYELRHDKDIDHNGVGNIFSMELGGGTFKAFHDFQNSTITGVGEYNTIERFVEIKYSAL